jgi:hypothetical protein
LQPQVLLCHKPIQDEHNGQENGEVRKLNNIFIENSKEKRYKKQDTTPKEN